MKQNLENIRQKTGPHPQQIMIAYISPVLSQNKCLVYFKGVIFVDTVLEEMFAPSWIFGRNIYVVTNNYLSTCRNGFLLGSCKHIGVGTNIYGVKLLKKVSDKMRCVSPTSRELGGVWVTVYVRHFRLNMTSSILKESAKAFYCFC